MSKNIKEILNQFNTEMAEEVTPTDDVNKDNPEDKNIDPANSDDKKDNPEEKKDEKPEEKQEPEKKIDEPEDKKDEKPEDKKEEPEQNEKDEKITGLEAENQRLKDELAKLQSNNGDKVALEQANTLLNVQKNLVSEYEGILNTIIDAKLADVPENLKELVPANLSLQQKLDWITKAEKSGIFGKQPNTDIEIGKPLNPNNGKQNTDTSKLSASSLMAMAYGNSSKGKGKK